MRDLRRFFSPVLAEQAAAYLREHGVLARVVGQLDVLGGISPNLAPRGQFVISIASERDAADALELLELFDAEVEELDEERGREAGEGADHWEAPDLSLLDPAQSPRCPTCHRALPMRAELAACPSCGGEVDVLALLVEEHGPEVLDACYGGGEITIPDALLHDAAIPCHACGSSLAGRPPRGRCPACGELYDKPAFIRRFLGDA
ncbi:MAG: hypothetical protein ACF8SC_06655 [Phycisphaerales bacterium JB037]